MSTVSVPPRQRLLALALLLAVLASGYVLVQRVLLAKYQLYEETLDELQARLVRYTALVEQRPQLEARIQALRQDQSVATQLLERTSPNLAATALQQHLKQAVESNGGSLLSTQILPAANEGGFTRIGLRAQINADVPTLQKLLHALESARPLLFVDNLQINAQRLRERPRDPKNRDAKAVKEITRLVVTFDLAGYMYQPAAEGGS
ncbi:MAG TPA: type II secretion system protein GspM [Candidatus Competibacteraceae bacterium]|nr:type II secretion system protein GspM [Candidatus Competibacteraceae bacterium]